MSASTLLMKHTPDPLATEPEVPPTPILRIPNRIIKDLAEVFRMLADKSRLKIVLALLQEGRLHVNALVEIVNRGQPLANQHSQPAISHHLTLMRIAGLVDFDRRGKNNFYFLAASNLRELLEGFFQAAGTSSLDLEEFSLSYTARPTA